MKYSYAIFDMDGLMFDTENLFVTLFETRSAAQRATASSASSSKISSA